MVSLPGLRKSLACSQNYGNRRSSQWTYLILDHIQLLIYRRETTEVVRWLLPAASFLGCYPFLFFVSPGWDISRLPSSNSMR